MPTWPTHILIAKKLNKTLNLDSNFIIGNVITDAINGYLTILSERISHHESHYHYNKDGELTSKIDFDTFINKYQNNLDNPMVLGYLTHLLTDSYFNGYTYENHYIDKDKVRLKDGNIQNCSRAVRTRMKQIDFATYGDYIANNHNLGPILSKLPNTYAYLSKLNEIDYQENDLDKIIETINQVIAGPHSKEYELSMFTIEELNQVMDGCYKYIIDYLEKNNLIK